MDSPKRMSTVALLQAIATFFLLVWRPTRLSAQGARFILFGVSGFFAGIFLLAGLFTLWWPPRQPFLVLWSATTFVLLFWMVVRGETN